MASPDLRKPKKQVHETAHNIVVSNEIPLASHDILRDHRISAVIGRRGRGHGVRSRLTSSDPLYYV